MRRFTARAEDIFLFFAATFGVLFVFLTPPFGGGDETLHYQRIATIAYGHVLNEKAAVPFGIVDFRDKGFSLLEHNVEPPGHVYTLEQYNALAKIPLHKETLATIEPHFITIYNPVVYLPQLLAFRVGAMLEKPPIWLFYASRLIGLGAALWLTFLAIRLVPSHRYVLCALALLPTIVFYRSYLNADTITNALGFFFVACAFKEITATDRLKTSAAIRLVVSALLFTQCKGAYILFPFLTLAIPAQRFSSTSARIGWLFAFIVPATLGGIGWMLLMKQTYFTGINYHTWGGDVRPDAQVAFILHQPFEYIKVLWRTVFSNEFVVRNYGEFFGSLWFIRLPGLVYLLLTGLLIMCFASDDSGNDTVYNRRTRLLAGTIFIGTFIISLTLLYIQWTGLQAPAIAGFQGRYFSPLLPLLFVFIRPISTARIPARIWVMLLAVIGLSAAAFSIKMRYFG